MLPFIFYTSNVTLTGLLNYFLIKHIAKLGRDSHTPDERFQIKLHYARAVMMPVIFMIGVVISLLTFPVVGRMAPVLISVYIALIKRIYKVPRQTVEK